MTRTIQLDIPEPLYEAVVKAASANGTTAEEWILKSASARLPSPVEAEHGTGKRFRDSFGTINSGNPRSADNEAIDADLAAAYGGVRDEG
jgi:hypothetical protein